jgi:hypothetical protein
MLSNRTLFRNFAVSAAVVGAISAVLSCQISERDVDIEKDAGATDAGGIIWVDPVTGECPSGLKPGVCGLRGRCIECTKDKECPFDDCWSDGFCQGSLSYAIASFQGHEGNDTGTSFGFASEVCYEDYECGSGEWVCIDLRCVLPCSTADDCWPGQYCHDGQYCDDLKCPPEGKCPAGFREIEGSLRCYYDGDPELDGGAGAGDGGADDTGSGD